MLAVMSEPRAEPIGAPRVLVVDDEPSITDAVATALRYEGFEAREAAGGRAAERMLAEFRPDLVLLDVMMPDLDGLAGRAPAARAPPPHAGDLPHGARRDRGQAGRAWRWATTT